MAGEHGVGFFVEVVVFTSVCHGVSASPLGSVSGADQVVDYLAVGFAVGEITLGVVDLSLVRSLILVGRRRVGERDGGWWTAFFVG